MPRLLLSVGLVGLSLSATQPVSAQGSGTVPIREDLRRNDINKERLEMLGRPVEGTGSVTKLPAGAQSDPSGVAGFNGPPGAIGDSVNSYGALPQGATGSDIR